MGTQSQGDAALIETELRPSASAAPDAELQPLLRLLWNLAVKQAAAAEQPLTAQEQLSVGNVTV